MLYKMADKPPVPTSGKRVFKDISETEDATHVYVKVDKPESLAEKFEGPYRILSRPSRSRIEVKLGMYRNGGVRSQIYHWHSCKVANMREGQEDASRPKLGRPSKTSLKVSKESKEPLPFYISPVPKSSAGSEGASSQTDADSVENQNGRPRVNNQPVELGSQATTSSDTTAEAAGGVGAKIQTCPTRST